MSMTWHAQELAATGRVPQIVPYVRYPTAADNQALYYVPRGGGLGGAKATQLTFPGAHAHVQPELSPDSTRIVFAQNGADVRVVDVKTGTITFLANFNEGATFGINARFRWKPDGTRILYADNEQFPSRVTLYSIAADGSELPVQLWQATPGFSIGDFGYAYDGSFVVFNNLGTLYRVNDDGTGLTSLGVSVPAGSGTRVTPGHVSDLIVWVDHVNDQIRKCTLDGSGVTTIQNIGPNAYRFSNHILSADDSTVVYCYDTLGWASGDGYFTSSIGKDSQVLAVDVASGDVTETGIWTYMETESGNIGNNPVDVPHAFYDRFYIGYNAAADGGEYPNGDANHYRFGSARLDGSDRRVEDLFDTSDDPTWPAWARITMERPIGG